MRFISVYWQSKRVQALGFSTQQESIYFLGWGYPDNDLVPYGLYDSIRFEVSLYQHSDESIICSDLNLIGQAAQHYLRNYNHDSSVKTKEAIIPYFKRYGVPLSIIANLFS